MIVNAAKLKMLEPAASPSNPSVKFTAFAAPEMSSTAQRLQPTGPMSQPMPPARVNDSSVLTSVARTVSAAKPPPTAHRPSILARLLRPLLSARVTLSQSSSNPTQVEPRIASITKIPVRVKMPPWM